MNEKIDVLSALDWLVDKLPYEGEESANRFNEARAAIAELIEATPSLLALYRIKWGNLDPDANAVLATFERAFSRVGGVK